MELEVWLEREGTSIPERWFPLVKPQNCYEQTIVLEDQEETIWTERKLKVSSRGWEGWGEL